jgi:hypothetical protein
MASNTDSSIFKFSRVELILIFALVLCVGEGALRKWVLGDTSFLSRVAYISKDFVFALCILIRPFKWGLESMRLRNGIELGLLLMGAGAVISSISDINFLGSVLSTRTFFILPVAAIYASLSLNEKSIHRIVHFIAVLAVVNAVLSAIQFYTPSTSWINRYSTEDSFVATVGFADNVRATGSFSYISGLGYFGFFAVWAATMILAKAKHFVQFAWGTIALSSALLCSLVTASRSIGLMVLFQVLAWLIAGSNFGQKIKIVLIVGFVGIFLFITDSGNELVEIGSVVHRRAAVTNDDLFSRLEYQFVSPVIQALDLGPMGVGYGTEQAGGGGELAGNRHRSSIESPWGRLILEVGIIGLFGFLITCGTVIAVCIRGFKNSETERRSIYMLTGFCLVLNFLVGFQFNHVAGFEFWFMAALITAYSNRQNHVNNSLS